MDIHYPSMSKDRLLYCRERSLSKFLGFRHAVLSAVIVQVLSNFLGVLLRMVPAMYAGQTHLFLP
ncbi:MAG: hypothetical protein BGN99_28120 [Alphaproteobacteria bacterium 65-37]|nr:MAG: hypothetical protein BGN99_28120 [Alphaproteobacteria bacterium 65-37]